MSTAGPDSTPCVAATMTRSAPCSNSASAAFAIVPPVSIMSSTRMQVRPATWPDDLEDLDLVGDVRIAPLVDDRERAAEPVGPPLTDPDPAGVRRDHGHVPDVQLAFQVAGQDRQREQMVHRPVEEALDLRGVQVDGHQPVRARGGEQVSDQPRRDRFAPPALLILPRVAEERHHHRDPLRRRPLERVDHDQVFHDPLVDRRGVALQHEGVAAANRLKEPDHDLAVGEVVQPGRRRLDP